MPSKFLERIASEVSNMGGTLSIVIVLLTFPLVAVNQNHPYPKTIPIGAIFHKDAVEVKVGFNYAIVSHKESEGRETFELEATVDMIDVSSSYELTSAICSRMEGGVFAVFGMKNISSLSVIQSLTRKFHMPYLSPSLSKVSSDGGSEFELHMKPSYTDAMIHLIMSYGWSSFYYIYDSDTGLLRLQELYKFQEDNPGIYVRILPRRLVDVYNAHDELRLIDKIENQVMLKAIVVDLSSQDRYQVFLKQIAEVGMNKHGYHYLFGGLGFNELDLDSFRHGGVNITGFQLLNYSSPKLQDFLNKWVSLSPRIWPGAGQKKINYTTALMIDSVQVFVTAIKRMIAKKKDIFKFTFRRGRVYNNGTEGVLCEGNPVNPWIHGADIMAEMKKVDLEGLTGHVAFDERGQRRDYTLGIYELGLHYGPVQVHEWNSADGLNGEIGNEKVDDKSSEMMNRSYIVSTIINEPYLMMKDDCPDGSGRCPMGNQKYIGYCADLAVEIAKEVEFDYILQPVKDSRYGNKPINGSWTGMIGELVRGEADVAIADLTITVEREMVVDFSKPFMDLGISIMIKKPQTEKPGVFSFMAPLSSYIWMCIIIAYVGVSIGLFIVSRLSPYEWKQMLSASGSVAVNEFDVLNSFWFSLGALMQQGSDFFPRSISGRVIGSVWWFFTLIIISSYTANLAAFLTIERMTTPIESADDLVQQTEIEYGTLKAGSTYLFFQKSKVATYERMWAYMSSNPSVFVSSVQQGVQRVRQSKGKYAFMVESTTNDYIKNRKPCNTIKVGTNLDSKNFGIATPAGSPIGDRISLAVLKLHEDGCLTKLKQKWWYDKGECGPQDGSSKEGSLKRPLSLSNVAGIFYILIGGLALSMIVGLFELLLKSKIKRSDKVESNLQVLLTAPSPPVDVHANDISTIGVTQNNRSYHPPPPQERENGAFASDYPPPEKSVSTYSYGAPRLIGFEPLQESVSNSHTQV